MTDTAEQPRQRGYRKARIGRVISNKMQKTVVVAVEDRKSHPLYKKVVRRQVSYKVHDEQDECRVGDLIRIMETRPISKDKRWRVAEIVERAR